MREDKALQLMRRMQRRAGKLIAGGFKTVAGNALDVELHLTPIKQALDNALNDYAFYHTLCTVDTLLPQPYHSRSMLIPGLVQCSLPRGKPGTFGIKMGALPGAISKSNSLGRKVFREGAFQFYHRHRLHSFKTNILRTLFNMIFTCCVFGGRFQVCASRRWTVVLSGRAGFRGPQSTSVTISPAVPTFTYD